ncbi:hypothetical protein BDZ85DRAFT_321286, partial [Elsinoe ampelina]
CSSPLPSSPSLPSSAPPPTPLRLLKSTQAAPPPALSGTAAASSTPSQVAISTTVVPSQAVATASNSPIPPGLPLLEASRRFFRETLWRLFLLEDDC